MKYYKGVKVLEDGKRVSAFIKQSNAQIEYKVGEWVSPKLEHQDYGIFVSTRPSALDGTITIASTDDEYLYDFIGGRYEIYECEVELSEFQMMPFMFDFWDDSVRTHKGSAIRYNERTTLLVKRCKLGRKLTAEEATGFYIY